MKHYLILCIICATCLSLDVRPDRQTACDCTLPEGSNVAMNKGYDETALGNAGFKVTGRKEGWCEELDAQRLLIEKTLRRASVGTNSCHQLLIAERNGYAVKINYFLLTPEEIPNICKDLVRKKRMLAGKVPVMYEFLCIGDYLLVATSEGIDDTELKAVMVVLGVDPESLAPSRGRRR